MPNWGPSWWGRLFTRSDDWRLQVDAESIRVIRGTHVEEVEFGDGVVHVEEGAWWAALGPQCPGKAATAVPELPRRRALEAGNSPGLRDPTAGDDVGHRAGRQRVHLSRE